MFVGFKFKKKRYNKRVNYNYKEVYIKPSCLEKAFVKWK